MTDKTERKRKELLQFIKTVGAPHIFTMYNFYLKETGCEELDPRWTRGSHYRCLKKKQDS